MADNEVKKQRHTLPQGRVINHSLFQRDIYKDERGNEADPTYKIELAFDPGKPCHAGNRHEIPIF